MLGLGELWFREGSTGVVVSLGAGAGCSGTTGAVTGAGGPSGINGATGSAGVLFAENFAGDSYLIGLVIPAGAQGNVLASWQMGRPVGEYAGLGFKNQQIVSVGYTYQFTTRTNLYAYASYGQNFAMVETAQSSMIGVGIRHQF